MPVDPGLAALGAQAGGVAIMQACAGLGDTAQQNGDRGCVDPWLGRHEGCGPAEQRSCRPVQA
jgi:hypothetical protein